MTGLDRGADRRRSAPLCVWGFLLLSLCGASTVTRAAPDCRADRIDEKARVSHVTDGDSLVLNDGRRLRLIGINTPEMGDDNRPPQPGALAARERLRQWIFMNRQQIALRFDQEREDRYGRLLGHAFLDDGSNLNERLLRQGLGHQLAVPPNVWAADCYQMAQLNARRQSLGIWGLADYQLRRTETLDLHSNGFMRIQGRVTHISDSPRALWVNLAGPVALRIDREDLVYFSPDQLNRLSGTEIQAQGWLYKAKGQLRMQIRHPSAIPSLASPPPGTGSSPVE